MVPIDKDIKLLFLSLLRGENLFIVDLIVFQDLNRNLRLMNFFKLDYGSQGRREKLVPEMWVYVP